jgi:PIN domain nuclease of toxin-antitoxin system
MKLLLDTCAFLWFQAAAADLSNPARVAILDSDNEVYLSAVSAWEIGRKYANGSLTLDMPPEILIPRVRDESGIESLVLTEADALMAEKLPRLHKDPFDRMLIAQALGNGMTIVTSDTAFNAYPVRVLW